MITGLKNSGGSDTDITIQRAAIGIEVKKKLMGKLEPHYADRSSISHIKYFFIFQWRDYRKKNNIGAQCGGLDGAARGCWAYPESQSSYS